MYGKGKGGKEIRTVRTGGEGKENVWEKGNTCIIFNLTSLVLHSLLKF